MATCCRWRVNESRLRRGEVASITSDLVLCKADFSDGFRDSAVVTSGCVLENLLTQEEQSVLEGF